METTVVTAVGRRILEQRKALGLSQVELAKLAGVSRQWVSLVELGQIQSPGGKSLDAVAQALGVSPHYLLHGSAHDTVPVQASREAAPRVRHFAGFPAWLQDWLNKLGESALKDIPLREDGDGQRGHHAGGEGDGE